MKRKPDPIPPSTVAKIRSLVPEARLARRQHGPLDPKSRASVELTRILKELYAQGWTIAQLSEAANITYHSVRARIFTDDKS